MTLSCRRAAHSLGEELPGSVHLRSVIAGIGT